MGACGERWWILATSHINIPHSVFSYIPYQLVYPKPLIDNCSISLIVVLFPGSQCTPAGAHLESGNETIIYL